MARKNGLGCLLLASRPARNSFCAGSTIFTAVAIGSSIEPGQEFTVPFEEVKRSQFVRRLPTHLFENQISRLPVELHHAKEDQQNRLLAGIRELVTCDLSPSGIVNVQFFS